MSASLCSEQYTRSVREGFLRHNYTRQYKVPVINNSLVSSCNDSNLPVLGSSIALEGITYWAVEHIPRRLDDENGRQLAYIDVVYSNDAGQFARDENGQPTTNPVNVAPYVQIQWQTRMVEQAGGIFVRVEDDDGNTVPAPPFINSKVGQNVMVTNSAGVPNGTYQVERHFKQIVYWTYHATWDPDWEDHLDRTNRSSFTITQRDSTGVKCQYSIGVKGALLVDMQKEDHWMGDRLYFRRGIVMHIERDAWIQKIHDRGMQWAVFDGQVNYRATPQRLFTPQELNANGWLTGTSKGLKPVYITDDQGNLVQASEPVPLNGYGAPQWARRGPTLAQDTTFKNYYMCYDPYFSSEWPTALNIS